MNEGALTTKSPLVSTAWLSEHLLDPSIRVIEVSREEVDPAYDKGHIPGAVWWQWKAALWHESDREFPAPEEMAARLGRIGVSPETTVVIYGDPVQYGTYAFWVLTMCGHRRLKLLDGGRKGWLKEGRPTTREVLGLPPVDYSAGQGDSSSRIGRDEILEGLSRAGRFLLDVRTPAEYKGERVRGQDPDHGAERAGRIPGAAHLFFRHLLNENDTFKPAEELTSILKEVGASPENVKEIVTYCRLSHRASLAWFVMRFLLGWPNVRVYDGSWTEWGSIVGVPVEK